jgi:hypothetical protein
MVIFNNTPLKGIDSTPDAAVSSFGTVLKEQDEHKKVFSQLLDKNQEKIKSMEEEIESMKVIITTLRAAKPGYACLSKKRGAVARINHIPVKLNKKIA